VFLSWFFVTWRELFYKVEKKKSQQLFLSILTCWVFWFVFETGTCYVAQSGLKLGCSCLSLLNAGIIDAGFESGSFETGINTITE
jgi:hypothetical protein